MLWRVTAGSPPPATAPRTLAEDLRSRGDDELAALLLARPELAVPAPHDTTSLAARASTRVSAQRALDRLTTPELQVLEVMAALAPAGPTSVAEVARASGAEEAQVEPLVQRLRALALVWGRPGSLTLVRAAGEALGPAPAGLGPPLVEALGMRSPSRTAALVEDLGLGPTGDPVAGLREVAALLGDPARLEQLLADAPAPARDLLDRLTWGPPAGGVEHADRQVRAADARTPLEWLLARGLLAPAGSSAVVLPREVAVALRGGRIRDGLDATPPPVEATPRDPARVGAQGASAAAELVRLVHELLRTWSTAPPPVLRAGGLGVRELRRAAQALEVDGDLAAFVVELARAAGLLGDDEQADPAWAPTPAYDRWLEHTTAERWAVLAQAWLATSRVPALVGRRDDRGATRGALGDDLDRTAAPQLRRAALGVLADHGPGGAAEEEQVLAAVRWARPRRGGGPVGALLVPSALREAGHLGVTGLGALTAPGRALLAGAGPDDAEAAAAAASALQAALPEPVEQVLLQADLTAVAPGPLVAEVAEVVEQLADVDSRGGATVYRFSPASVRRAMDAGRTAAEVLAFLAAHSATPVPQPLQYLVTDVARRHGRLRVGVASAYLRSDDEAALAEVLADRRAAALRLRSLAPTVAAAQAEPEAVLQVLRSMGLAPAVEGADADVVLRAPALRRTPARTRPRPVTGEPPPVGAAQAAAVVAALRAQDAAAPLPQQRAGGPADGGGPPALPAVDPPAALALLREAAATQRPVWLAVTDHTGRRRPARVQPLSVEAGAVVVVDAETGAVQRVSAHRVAAVAWAG